MKLSFKKSEKETGLRAVGAAPRSSSVKVDGKEVGTVYFSKSNFMNPNAPNKWIIQLHVDDSAAPGGWKNVTLKDKFDTDEAAKAFVTTRINDIVRVFKLHSLDR